MTTVIAEPINSGDVFKLLRGRYCAPSYVLLDEVRNTTGFSRKVRSMDAMAFGLWPSRGLEIIGFEIKVSRSDWLRELKDPAKADEFWKYLDRWYVVAPEGIAQKSELPIGWGLLEVKGDRLKVTQEATPKKANVIDRSFLMSIMRNFDERYVQRTSVEQLATEKAKSKIEAAVQDAIWNKKRDTEELASLRERVKKFEAASGVVINGWDDVERIGRAVKLVMEFGEERIRENMKHTISNLRFAADQIEKGLGSNDKTC